MGTGANSISETFNGLVDGDINGKGSYTNASAWDTTGTGAGCSAIVYDTGGGAKQLRLIDDVAGQRVKVGITLDSGYRSMSGYVQFDWCCIYSCSIPKYECFFLIHNQHSPDIP